MTKMPTISMIILTTIIAIAPIFAVVLFLTKNTSTRPFTDHNGNIIMGSVAEQLYLRLNGVNQWILLRGQNIHNPVLIFLHGGPGISLHGLFRYFHKSLENYFIIVGWDQRGAGKSYSTAISQDSMNIATFMSDLHELIKSLKKRFNQDKVYILGESWGSLLGTLYAQKYPEDVIAYIGTGQISDTQESERLGCEFALAKAKTLNNKEAVTQLLGLKQPLCSKVHDVLIQRKWLMKFGGCLHKKTSYLPWMFKILCVDEYAWPDLLKIGPGSTMAMNLLWPEIFSTNFFNQAPEFKVPVYFLLGRHDQQVSSKLAAQYFHFLKAPKKELIWFEHSGHNPMFEEPELFRKALLSIRLA